MNPARWATGISWSWRSNSLSPAAVAVVGGQHLVQKRWADAAQHLRGPLPVGLEDGCLPGAVADHLAERGQRRTGSSGSMPWALEIGRRRLGTGHAAAAPGAEVDGGGRQAVRPALGDQAVEQRVGGA